MESYYGPLLLVGTWGLLFFVQHWFSTRSRDRQDRWIALDHFDAKGHLELEHKLYFRVKDKLQKRYMSINHLTNRANIYTCPKRASYERTLGHDVWMIATIPDNDSKGYQVLSTRLSTPTQTYDFNAEKFESPVPEEDYCVQFHIPRKRSELR